MTPKDIPNLERIYEQARKLFLLGKHEEARENFLRVYEVDCMFRDVAATVNDYYLLPNDGLISKYEAQFQRQAPARNEASARRQRPMTLNERLLALLASGAKFECLITELPQFKNVIESAFDWMKTQGRCAAAQVARRADQLRELIQRKQEALRPKDFELAANIRAEECALYKSFGLEESRGRLWSAISRVGIDEQIKTLSAQLDNTETS